MKSNRKPVTIVINPFYRGIGFVIYESLETEDILRYGRIRIDKATTKDFTTKARQMLEYYDPDIVLLVSSEGHTNRSKRVMKAVEEIFRLASDMKLKVELYTQEMLKKVFEQFGVTAKYQRSRLIANMYPMLKRYEPKDQVTTFIEGSYNTPIFDAFALMIAYEDQMMEKED